MDANQLAAAGFYFTDQSDIVRCVFCGVEIGYWTDGYDALKELQEWSPSCGFMKGFGFKHFYFSNDRSEKIYQQPTRARDMCRTHN